MGQFYPQAVYTTPKMPDKPLFGGANLPKNTPPPTGTINDTMGHVDETGLLAISTKIACNLTLYLWCPAGQINNTNATNAEGTPAGTNPGFWINPGLSTQYTQPFTTNNMQFFEAAPGTEFYISTDTTSTLAWHTGKPPRNLQLTNS